MTEVLPNGHKSLRAKADQAERRWQAAVQKEDPDSPVINSVSEEKREDVANVIGNVQ